MYKRQGLRRKSKIKEELERYSIIRTVTAVERADVVLVVIDATEGVTEQDAKIAGIAHERGKGIIIVVNKWDAIEKNDKTMKEYENNVRRVLSFMPYAEIMYVSAETGQRLNKLYDMIDMVIENQTLRVATGVLNEIMTEAVAMQQPPSDKGKRLKLYYITQVAVKPPSFVIFVNNKEPVSYTHLLGAKVGRPEKTVVNIAGDGCFRMNMNEIATATRHNIPVIQVVINNHVLGMVRQWQNLFYEQRYSATVLNDAVDFVKLAEAMGAEGVRASTREEFKEAFAKALKSGHPVVIDCQIDSDDKVWPMVAPGAPISEAFDEKDLKTKNAE